MMEMQIRIHQFPHDNLNLFKRLLDYSVRTPTYALRHLSTDLRVSWAQCGIRKDTERRIMSKMELLMTLFGGFRNNLLVVSVVAYIV